MSAVPFVADVKALLQSCPPPTHSGGVRLLEATLNDLAVRVRGEYEEMPGLRLTVSQAARLFNLSADVAHAVLEHLHRSSILSCSRRGSYALNR